jgi:hypothetical protein
LVKCEGGRICFDSGFAAFWVDVADEAFGSFFCELD